MNEKLLNTKILGVINFTPDSFSENHKTLNEHKNLIHSKLNEFKSYENLIFDFGFESTAPFNSPITLEEEKNRFLEFFLEIKNGPNVFEKRWVSFDTYKIENFDFFKNTFETYFCPQEILFNDVSGVIDQKLITYLKLNPKVIYILNFTNIMNRNDVLFHQNFLKEGDIVNQCLIHFEKAINIFQSENITNTIIFDFGFGFSKTYNQNFELLENLEKVIYGIEKKFGPKIWAIGISKKSFLRKKLNFENISEEALIQSEKLHLEYLKKIFSKQLNNLIIRAHEPKIVKMAIKGENFA